MSIRLDSVHFKDGTVIRSTDEGIEWIEAHEVGARVFKGQDVKLYPWHRVHLCVEAS